LKVDEDLDITERRADDEFIEIEAELLPAKSLFKRPGVAAALLNRRYVRTREDTTMDHLGEFIYQICCEEMRSLIHADDAENSEPFSMNSLERPTPIAVQRPEHFYVYYENPDVVHFPIQFTAVQNKLGNGGGELVAQGCLDKRWLFEPHFGKYRRRGC
uniref:Uncharacterized protein n=1 Tax=Parascaris equorum TaxID=6256 RepID=A0A914RIV0_PAREQ